MSKRIKGVELTGVVTLFYSHYCWLNGVLEKNSDPQRERLVRYFTRLFQKKGCNPHQLLTLNHIPFQGILNVAVRSLRIDRLAEKYAKGREIVNIGCGFDTRYFRCGREALRYTDVDLPEVIQKKKKLLGETENYRMLSVDSAFEPGFWGKKLKLETENPLIIAEGVFCYIPYRKVLAFARELFQEYPGAVLICDVYLYEPHLVFDDIKSRILLGNPESGTEKYDRYRRFYMFQEKIRSRLAKRRTAGFHPRRWLNLVEVYSGDRDRLSFEFQKEKYTASYWIGVYERKVPKGECKK